MLVINGFVSNRITPYKEGKLFLLILGMILLAVLKSGRITVTKLLLK